MDNVMVKDRTSKIMFGISLVFQFVFAATFLMMPSASSISLNEGRDTFLYFVGALFWISLLLSQVMMFCVTLKRKKYYKNKEKRIFSKLPSAFVFFSSKEAKIADILMILMIVAFVISVFATDNYLIYVFLFLSVLMFEIHCVLNGKNYIYMKELKSGGTAQ